ncbi:unnamed protein product [Medioppia subpectinata]|uniref:N-acetyltransferase domain-containing protein n=1 Tax=Medioppia subpectinata TaxID=1979941 RepID=A0A7R9KB18_9ACAR|nr:unnamed protein product [Medioppia subpectinata]CAG2100127.1 unnamed protein product [Medioppia subpectinata]
MQLSDEKSVQQIWLSIGWDLLEGEHEMLLMTDPNGLFVAQDINTDKVLGVCCSVNLSQEISFIYEYGVLKECQGLGIGTALWEKACQLVKVCDGLDRSAQLRAINGPFKSIGVVAINDSKQVMGYCFVSDTGICSGFNLSPELAYMCVYAVRPEYQGLGIGTALWDKAMKHMGDRNASLFGNNQKVNDIYKNKHNFTFIPQRKLLRMRGKPVLNNLITSIDGIFVVDMNDKNIADVIEYDKQVCDGLNRSAQLRALNGPFKSIGVVAFNDRKQVVGFCFASETLSGKGKLLGVCCSVNLSPELSFIYSYAVRPEYQGLGIGTALWDKAMKHMGDRNASLFGDNQKVNDIYKNKHNFTFIPQRKRIQMSGKPVVNGLTDSIPGICLVDMNDKNIADVIEYDKQVCDGLDRSAQLRALNGQFKSIGVVAINDCKQVDLYLKDLFSLQRVSQQFSRCSQGVLRTKKRVSIGFNDLEKTSQLRYFNQNFEANDWNRVDITPAITLKGVDIAVDYRQHRLESIVRQFRGVKKLYLSKTVISFKTLKLFVYQWPQLEELYTHDINICGSSDKTITEWTQLLSKVKHITIGRIDTKYMAFMRDVIKELPSLQSIYIWRFSVNPLSATPITISSLAESLPTNLIELSARLGPSDSQTLDAITSKCQQIRKIWLNELSAFTTVEECNLWNQWFSMICDRLDGLRILYVILGDISIKNFSEGIAKLNVLKDLTIVFAGSANLPVMCFDTQSMAKHMQPMVSLRSLSLRGLDCSPNRWSNLAEMLPNVRKLSVYCMYYRADCDDGEDFNLCFYRCMDCVSKMPKLKHITIRNIIDGHITRHVLEVFNRMDRLSVDMGSEEKLIEVLIHFMVKTLANRRRVFRLDLVPKVKRELIETMNTMDIPMPESVIVGHVFSTRDGDQ